MGFQGVPLGHEDFFSPFHGKISKVALEENQVYRDRLWGVPIPRTGSRGRINALRLSVSGQGGEIKRKKK